MALEKALVGGRQLQRVDGIAGRQRHAHHAGAQLDSFRMLGAEERFHATQGDKALRQGQSLLSRLGRVDPLGLEAQLEQRHGCGSVLQTGGDKAQISGSQLLGTDLLRGVQLAFHLQHQAPRTHGAPLRKQTLPSFGSLLRTHREGGIGQQTAAFVQRVDGAFHEQQLAELGLHGAHIQAVPAAHALIAEQARAQHAAQTEGRVQCSLSGLIAPEAGLEAGGLHGGELAPRVIFAQSSTGKLQDLATSG